MAVGSSRARDQQFFYPLPLLRSCRRRSGSCSRKSYVGSRTNSLDAITLAQALGIGLFQVLSLWPGTSRSAATIVGGVLLGLDRKGAAEFSFLIAVPIMVIVTGYEMSKIGATFSRDELKFFFLGFAVAFVVALL